MWVWTHITNKPIICDCVCVGERERERETILENAHNHAW